MTSSAERFFRAIVCAAFVLTAMGVLVWWTAFAFSLPATPPWISMPLFFAPFVLMAMLIGSFASLD